MKNPYNLWPAKARLSTTVYQGERKVLDALQEQYKKPLVLEYVPDEHVPDVDDYLALLPTECWVHYPLGKSHVIYLYDRPTGGEGRTLVAPFVGKTTLEAARKAAEYVQRIGGVE